MAKIKDKKKKGDQHDRDRNGSAQIAELDGSNGSAGGNGAAGGVVSAPKMSGKEFDKEMEKLQVELVKLQEWVKAKGAKVCVLFEGRDAAGKGGIIKRITERTSPRVFRVIATPSPGEREKSQMYIQRYIPHLPAGGEVVLFDRSWYNRAGVERVMGFANDQQVREFLAVVPLMERAIIKSGVILIKYWLEVSMENQTLRFQER